MASGNPFDLLGDEDNDDISELIAKKALALATAPAPQQQPKQQPKLPSKPLPPSQAVREAKTGGRGGGRGFSRGGFSRGRGGGRFNREPRDTGNNENVHNNNGVLGEYASSPPQVDYKEDRHDGVRFRSRVGGSYHSGDGGEGEHPRRVFERRSGTGRGYENKRDGFGRGNWGTNTGEEAPDAEDVVAENEKNVGAEKQPGEEETVDANKEVPVTETEEKEPEDKEMTLEEYEKVLEEKRKALQALKTEERKVDVKEFQSMQQIASKKSNNEIFIKLGAEKDKRKELADKEERAKKSVSINEFLKPAEGGRNYSPGGRGRGRGRGSRGVFSGNNIVREVAPAIHDAGQFPTLGAM